MLSPWCPRQPSRWWGRPSALCLRPARCTERPPAVAKGLRGLPASVCETRRVDGGGRGGRALLRPLPSRALAEDMVQQPPRASQQGDQEKDERGGHIPDGGIGDKACGLGTLRAARRVAGLQTLLQRWVLGEARTKGGTDGRTAATGGQLRSGEGWSCTGLLHT